MIDLALLDAVRSFGVDARERVIEDDADAIPVWTTLSRAVSGRRSHPAVEQGETITLEEFWRWSDGRDPKGDKGSEESPRDS